MTCPVCGAAYEEPADSCPACGAQLLPLAPGAVVAERYEVRSLLGRGGMGAVYRVFDRVLHEEVALKIQRADAARDPDAERRFRNEVKLARQVTHQNVGRLHDGGLERARRWISMELVEGTTVSARLREGPLSSDEVWSLALQAADGLAAVHLAGVVHRDLKTLNLMVDVRGRLRLMDFGIAKPAVSGDTGAGSYALGSPEYMSPEQARGRPADARSDVYSLGIVIFELFTGKVPFRADTPVATLLQHLEAKPPLERVPEALRPLLARALAKDPAERWADGEAMAAALRAVREARPATPVAARVGARQRLLVAFAALGVVTAVVGLLWRDTPRAAPTLAASPVSPGAAVPGPFPSPSPSASSVSATPGSVRARPAPRPTPVPVSVPTLAPTPAPASPVTPAPDPLETPAPTPTREEEGALLVVVLPWADVGIDGVPRGQTPLARIPLAPGRHNVLLTHPDYQPFPRRVTILPGETLRLVVDLKNDGVPR